MCVLPLCTKPPDTRAPLPLQSESSSCVTGPKGTALTMSEGRVLCDGTASLPAADLSLVGIAGAAGRVPSALDCDERKPVALKSSVSCLISLLAAVAFPMTKWGFPVALVHSCAGRFSTYA